MKTSHIGRPSYTDGVRFSWKTVRKNKKSRSQLSQENQPKNQRIQNSKKTTTLHSLRNSIEFLLLTYKVQHIKVVTKRIQYQFAHLSPSKQHLNTNFGDYKDFVQLLPTDCYNKHTFKHIHLELYFARYFSEYFLGDRTSRKSKSDCFSLIFASTYPSKQSYPGPLLLRFAVYRGIIF